MWEHYLSPSTNRASSSRVISQGSRKDGNGRLVGGVYYPGVGGLRGLTFIIERVDSHTRVL